jgi:thiamine-phosphate pyrophosphorylase
LSGMSALYLVVEQAPGAEAQLIAALKSGHAASVLIRPAPGANLDPSTSKRLVEIIQSHKSAALIADDANLARILKADGVHLSWSKDQDDRYAEAREILGPRFIAGADAGRSRHDAMSLAEAGADYVGFGIPPHVEDRATAIERRQDLIAWWAEIFEVPCVAFDVETVEEAANLARVNADFVALALAASVAPDAARQSVEDFATALKSGTPAGKVMA